MAAILVATNRTYVAASSDTRPANPPNGARLFETDTRLWYVYDGDAWHVQEEPPADLTDLLTAILGVQTLMLEQTQLLTAAFLK